MSIFNLFLVCLINFPTSSKMDGKPSVIVGNLIVAKLMEIYKQCKADFINDKA